MQALHAAQFEYDNRLPLDVSETAEEAAQRAWLDNAIEALLDRQDVTIQRRFRKAQSVTHLDFAEAIDHFITDGGMDASAGPAALGLLVLAGRGGVSCDVRAASANVVPEAKLREIARELLEPLAADAVQAAAEGL